MTMESIAMRRTTKGSLTTSKICAEQMIGGYHRGARALFHCEYGNMENYSIPAWPCEASNGCVIQYELA